VITRLLENGFRVSGTDLSPAMLSLARERHPGVNFENRMISELTYESEFDGACSLNSLLYLDPIDLYHSIFRLHQALKPGGFLYLFAYDSSPSTRGTPLREQFSSWLWGWDYGILDASAALEEHGYFKVIQAANVTTEEEKEQMIERWRKRELKRHEDFIKDGYPPGSTPPPPPDLTKVPDNLGYCYSILARREGS
jgi:SAM-dependent methyltransferase